MMKKTMFLTITLFIALTGVLSPPTFAQQTETIKVFKNGRFYLGKQVRVSDKTLKAGLYQVQHFMDGKDHIIVFKEVKWGYRHFQELGDEVARIKCRVEPVNKKVGDTKIMIVSNSAGEREASEVWIKGEKFKHILPT